MANGLLCSRGPKQSLSMLMMRVPHKSAIGLTAMQNVLLQGFHASAACRWLALPPRLPACTVSLCSMCSDSGFPL
jgi:hypothetical protein